MLKREGIGSAADGHRVSARVWGERPATLQDVSTLHVELGIVDGVGCRTEQFWIELTFVLQTKAKREPDVEISGDR